MSPKDTLGNTGLMGSKTWWGIVDGFPWTYRKGDPMAEFNGRVHPDALEKSIPHTGSFSLKEASVMIRYGEDRFGNLIAIAPRRLNGPEKVALAKTLLKLEDKQALDKLLREA
jgi:hypothetical protein